MLRPKYGLWTWRKNDASKILEKLNGFISQIEYFQKVWKLTVPINEIYLWLVFLVLFEET